MYWVGGRKSEDGKFIWSRGESEIKNQSWYKNQPDGDGSCTNVMENSVVGIQKML